MPWISSLKIFRTGPPLNLSTENGHLVWFCFRLRKRANELLFWRRAPTQDLRLRSLFCNFPFQMCERDQVKAIKEINAPIFISKQMLVNTWKKGQPISYYYTQTQVRGEWHFPCVGRVFTRLVRSSVRRRCRVKNDRTTSRADTKRPTEQALDSGRSSARGSLRSASSMQEACVFCSSRYRVPVCV